MTKLIKKSEKKTVRVLTSRDKYVCHNCRATWSVLPKCTNCGNDIDTYDESYCTGKGEHFCGQECAATWFSSWSEIEETERNESEED